MHRYPTTLPRFALALPVLLMIAVAASAEDAPDVARCVGETDAAARLALCARVLELPGLSDAERSAGLVARGTALVGLGQAQRALANFDAAIALTPNSAEAYRGRAEAHARLGRSTAAERDAALAATLGDSLPAAVPTPSPAAAAAPAADTAVAQSGCDDAGIDAAGNADAQVWQAKIARCTQVMESEALPASERAAALAMRAMARIRLGALEDGLADLGAAARMAPDVAFIHFGQGAAFIEAGRLDEAVAALDRAIALDPGYALAYMQRGNARARQAAAIDPYELRPAAASLVAAAMRDLDRAIALDGKLARAYALRADLRLRLQQDEAARADADTAIRLRPDLGLAYFVRGVSRSQQDQDGALADYDTALRHDPSLDGAHVFRGLIRMARGERGRALAEFDAAIRINPQNGLAYHDRGWLRVLDGDYAEAVPDLDRAVALRRDYASAHYLRAVAYAALGRRAEAQVDLARVRALDPTLIEQRGDPLQSATTADGGTGSPLLQACGEADQARRVALCTQAIESGRLSQQERADALVLRALGHLNAEPAKPERAAADVEAALRIDPAHSYAYRTRALARQRQGDWPGAMADFDAAVRLAPDEAYHYLLRGMALFEQGKRAAAQADFAKARTLDPAGAGAQADGFEVMLDMLAPIMEAQP